MVQGSDKGNGETGGSELVLRYSEVGEGQVCTRGQNVSKGHPLQFYHVIGVVTKGGWFIGSSLGQP